MASRLHFLRVVLVALTLGILYGIVHDMVTAHVCVEYFSKFHPQVIDSENPALLALIWGVVATWWVAAALGMGLGLAAAAGPRPMAPVPGIARKLAMVLVGLWFFSMVAGFIGSQTGGPLTPQFLHRSGLPVGKEARFWFDYWAHIAAYAGGVVAGIGLMVAVYRSRGR